jgi:hypothetical protein
MTTKKIIQIYVHGSNRLPYNHQIYKKILKKLLSYLDYNQILLNFPIDHCIITTLATMKIWP